MTDVVIQKLECQCIWSRSLLGFVSIETTDIYWICVYFNISVIDFYHYENTPMLYTAIFHGSKNEIF